MNHAFIVTMLCCTCQAFSQPIQLDMDAFAKRRATFEGQLATQGIAIFPCKPEYTRNGDVDYQYRQESNFYYLTGFEEPQSIVLLNPSAPRYKYILFVRKRDPLRETWQGIRAGTEGSMTTFRADTALVFDDFQRTVGEFIPKLGTLYYAFGTNPQLDDIIRAKFLERQHGDNWSITNPSPILAEMRLTKNDGDWKNGFTKAIDISAQAHMEAFKAIRPGMFECEVQAVFEYVYRKGGSPRDGYPCIVGSGPNSCTLHYDANTRRMNDGDVVLMDCAAEYGYYSADITRTVPVNGKFSSQQREIYQLVLDAQNAGINMIKPGILKSALDSAVNEVLGHGLVELGFIKDKKDSRVFTLHGFSHWLGLEVHDVGKYTVDGKPRVLAPGMVFTMEPGIYVRPDIPDKLRDLKYTDEEIENIRKVLEPYMNIGVRIEDDILVTENGFKNLSVAAPREIDAIEALMKH